MPSFPFTESPSKDDSPAKVNGFKVEEISLRGSSRGRQRRDSAENSPKHQRKSLTKGTLQSDTKKQEPAVNLRPKDNKSRDSKDNRGSSIVLDVDSILDQLMGSGEFDEDIGSDHEVKSFQRKPSPKQDSSIGQLATPPKGRNRGSRVMETTVESKSMLIDKETPPILKKTPPTPQSSVDQFKSLPGEQRSNLSSYQRNKHSSDLSTSKSPSFGRKEPLTNGQIGADEDSMDSFRMRTRSNALTKTDRSTPFKSKQDSITETAGEAENKREVNLKRSGSYSRRAQMSGDKALGIFYHNRRSQFIDHDVLDEAEKKLEASDSSSPLSPPSRNSRDVRGFSPIPQSPLASKGLSTEQEKKDLGNPGAPPPQIPAPSQSKEEELEVRTSVISM